MIDVSASGHYTGDCRELLARLPEASVQTCVTSPPYWGLRDYGVEGQIGLEATPEEYVASIVDVFRGVRRALRKDGTLWLNLGDSYANPPSGQAQRYFNGQGATYERGAAPSARRTQGKTRSGIPSGLKPKDLVGIPWMVAFALRADGWYLRADVIWSKPSPMPESVTDRPTKAHEYVFLLSKSGRYHYDADAIAEPSVWAGQNRTSRDPATSMMPDAPPHRGLRKDEPTGTRNCRSVWTIATQPYDGAHFAVMPPALAERCILATSKPGDIVLDPFFGSGTTGMIAEKHGRRWIGFDLNPAYEELQKKRTAQRTLGGVA
jgi:DNA modification methylase